ncbi:OLC1v1019598C1 [Oldenlandia corymbosa var. corymbosa]|uniref:OLC1v1019598C1 n=1 Tax=Oldenlandia corymbosa var. corymbosa TaxID=529605 RepID=A0AAV1EES8_OLDCO|nr:OLC1v1019598C1 [Oldenlandia corymbosa var. corymbosa]
MDSDQGKLFIGGISWETSEEKLRDYFGGYGEVSQTVVMRDKVTGKPRGFGFVVFSDPNVLDRVLQDRHVIDGRTVEAKRALSREEQQVSKVGNPSSGRSFGGGGNTRTKKIFVGGLPPSLTDDAFRQYFESYGNVTDVVIMFDQSTNRPRGFGFISFDSEDAVDRVLHKTFHDLHGKQVEVKRALPKDANPGGGGRSMGGGAGGYPYGSGGNSSSYDNRMDSGRYMQSQNAGGGYPPYGSSGYNTSGYGYGPSNNGMGYGSYGGYGGANPGYGPAASAYGNPNVPGAGFVGGAPGAPGAPRNTWNAQGSSGYGSVGYGTGSGGAAAGHSPGGAAGYGNQGYGYGGYGTNDGPYGNPSAYGASGGRGGSTPNSSGNGSGDLQAGGYMGAGYGDASGNSGYGNSGWRSDPSQNGPHGGQVGYGGGYGGAARQAQQQ